MAKKGLKHVVFAEKTSSGSYTNGKHVSPAVRVSINLTKAEGKDYGDDMVVDSESSVTGADIEVELNHDEVDIYTFLLGHREESVGNVVNFSVDDTPPIVGMGYVVNSTVTEGNRWVGIWVNEAKFSEPNNEANTKTDSINFQHITLSGDMLIPEDGIWMKRKVFTTASAAIAWIDGLAGMANTEGEGGN